MLQVQVLPGPPLLLIKLIIKIIYVVIKKLNHLLYRPFRNGDLREGYPYDREVSDQSELLGFAFPGLN